MGVKVYIFSAVSRLCAFLKCIKSHHPPSFYLIQLWENKSD